MSTARFNTWQNTDGTENFKCRAWVNFIGTGTVTIRASGNVSSVTDHGTGDYTVNLLAAMPDASFGSVLTLAPTATSNATALLVAKVAGSFRVQCLNASSALFDSGEVNAIVVR